MAQARPHVPTPNRRYRLAVGSDPQPAHSMPLDIANVGPGLSDSGTEGPNSSEIQDTDNAPEASPFAKFVHLFRDCGPAAVVTAELCPT